MQMIAGHCVRESGVQGARVGRRQLLSYSYLSIREEATM